MHWLEPYIIKEITKGGSVRLATLIGGLLLVYVNGRRLKPYRVNPIPMRTQ